MGRKPRICGHEHHPLDLRLRQQKPVERVAVMGGHRTEWQTMSSIYRDFRVTVGQKPAA